MPAAEEGNSLLTRNCEDGVKPHQPQEDQERMRSVLLATTAMPMEEVQHNSQKPGRLDGDMDDLGDPGKRHRLAAVVFLAPG